MENEYFWSITLEQGSIQASVWTALGETANVVAISNPTSWENEESLVSAADYVLSSCVQMLPENAAEPSKTVFGVPPCWVKDGQIERANLDKVRLLCNKLSLNPSGFVVLPEAIAHYKKSEEKTPISAVIVGVGDQNLDVSVFRLGNLEGTVNVARSEAIVDDVVEGLARFGTIDPLPSRFLLYASHSQDLEEVKQSLIQADWETHHEGVKFLHTPKVEVVENQEKMIAVSLAGASEIAHLTSVSFGEAIKKETQPQDEALQPNNNVNNLSSNVVDAASLGFAGENTVPAKRKLPKLNFKKIKLGKFMPFGLLIIPVLFLILFIVWWFVPKADVTITVNPKKIGGAQKITYDPKATSINVAKLIVPAKVVDGSATGEKTKTTTGTKTIGNPAKGQVTFYNSGDNVSLASGTVLTGSGMQFTLDSDVTVASGSAASIATTNGNVTSAGVGADNNLASGTIFSVANYLSSLQAKNSADLSGGSSQDVVAVAKEDIDSLSSSLLTQLTNTGKDNMKTSLTKDSILIETSVVATPSAKQFDHDAGEAATTVKLTETVKVSGLSVARADMNEIAKQIYKTQVPKGFSLNDTQIDFVLGTKSTTFTINLLPVLDPDKLVAQIAGKSIDAARKIVSQVPGFADLDVKITPYISFLRYLPHVPKNISIGVTAK